MMPANLPLDLKRTSGFSPQAFEVLGLRDYARFDLRLTQSEPRSSLKRTSPRAWKVGEAFARSAKWAGLDYPALIERLLLQPRVAIVRFVKNGKNMCPIDLPTGLVNLVVPAEVHVPPPSSIDLARLLDVHLGETVLDLGCGSGFLSIAAAKLVLNRSCPSISIREPLLQPVDQCPTEWGS